MVTTLTNTIAAKQTMFAENLKKVMRIVTIKTFSGNLEMKQSSLLCDTGNSIYWSCHLCEKSTEPCV